MIRIKMKYKMKLRQFLIFIIPRYPLFQVLSLLMFLGERAKIDTNPPFDPTVIYILVVLMFLTTLGMGYRPLRPQSAIVASILQTYLCFLYYINQNLQYHHWLKVKICQGLLGAEWSMLLYAYFSYQKPRPRWIQRVVEYLGAIIMTTEFFIMWYSGEDTAAFHRLISPSPIFYYAYILLVVAVALSYYNQWYTYEMTYVMGILWTCKVCLSSMNTSFWCTEKKVDFWTQVRLMGDGATLALGCVFYITSFIKPASRYFKSE